MTHVAKMPKQVCNKKQIFLLQSIGMEQGAIKNVEKRKL